MAVDLDAGVRAAGMFGRDGQRGSENRTRGTHSMVTRRAEVVFGADWAVGQTKAKATGRAQCIEMGGRFRLSRFELIKASYEIEHYGFGTNRNDSTFGIQSVTTLIARSSATSRPRRPSKF